MTADAQRINTIARDAAYLAQKNFKALAEAGVKVPLGAFSGIEALSGFGPPVTFKLLPVGAAHCSFRSAFTSAGINQTRHAVYLDIVLDITVVLPAGTSEFSESAEVMIIESVLSGKCPTLFCIPTYSGKAGAPPSKRRRRAPKRLTACPQSVTACRTLRVGAVLGQSVPSVSSMARKIAGVPFWTGAFCRRARSASSRIRAESAEGRASGRASSRSRRTWQSPRSSK